MAGLVFLVVVVYLFKDNTANSNNLPEEQTAGNKEQKDKEDNRPEIETVTANASPFYKEAYDLFTEGKIHKALNLLDEETLNETENKRNEESAKERILKAQLLERTYDFQAAENNYLKAVDIFPSLENNFQVANFYRKQNNFPYAETYYNHCLPLAKTLEEKAKVLNNVGLLHEKMMNYPKAAKAYKEAEDIYRELAGDNPKAYQPKLATTLNNVANLYGNLKNYPRANKAYEDYSKAKDAYMEALEIYRKLADDNPKAYQPDVATTLNNVGTLHMNNRDFSDAAKAYEEALTIRRQLAAENPQAYRPDLAATLNNVGILRWKTKELPKAKDAYEEALQIYRELADENPQAYQPDLAMTLANLALFYAKTGKDREQSIQYAREVLSFRPLLENIPDAQKSMEIADQILLYWEKIPPLSGRPI
ncbi:MAG: tetratricopeptide repeat protein [Tannerellaceae bacterium]|nr:tetratricopeptide repeat protein [Tannerellaceae bacterium]